jgi:hypothetical protein
MNEDSETPVNRDTRLENFVAKLTLAAYGVALERGTAGNWIDLEIDLWRALADTIKTGGSELYPCP